MGVRFASWTLFLGGTSSTQVVPGRSPRTACTSDTTARAPRKPQKYFTGLRAGLSLGARVGENVGHSPAPASQHEILGTAFDHLRAAMLAHHHTPPGVVAAPQWRSRSAGLGSGPYMIPRTAQVSSVPACTPRKLSISCRAGFDTTAARSCRWLLSSTALLCCRVGLPRLPSLCLLLWIGNRTDSPSPFIKADLPTQPWRKQHGWTGDCEELQRVYTNPTVPR
jgi:hypothetical protein